MYLSCDQNDKLPVKQCHYYIDLYYSIDIDNNLSGKIPEMEN